MPLCGMPLCRRGIVTRPLPVEVHRLVQLKLAQCTIRSMVPVNHVA